PEWNHLFRLAGREGAPARGDAVSTNKRSERITVSPASSGGVSCKALSRDRNCMSTLPPTPVEPPRPPPAGHRSAGLALLVSEMFPPVHGGSGRWFWEVYRRLPREDYVLAAGEHPRQDEFDRTHDLRVVRLPLAMRAWGLRSWAGLTGYLGTARRLRRLMWLENVRMVHCGRGLPEGFLAWMLRWWTGIPYACFVHGGGGTTARHRPGASWVGGRVGCGAR